MMTAGPDVGVPRPIGSPGWRISSWVPCHSERSEESRFVPVRERTRAGFFASLRMTSTEASLFDEPASATDEPRKAQKGAILGETKPLCGVELVT